LSCLTIPELKKLNIPKYADTDCALFMWVTDPLLDQAMELINAWGFKYKTVAFYWVKTNKNVDLKKLSSEKDFFTGFFGILFLFPLICGDLVLCQHGYLLRSRVMMTACQ